jgi:Holliday junction resolvasome RuvABC endonuclease subunit
LRGRRQGNSNFDESRVTTDDRGKTGKRAEAQIGFMLGEKEIHNRPRRMHTKTWTTIILALEIRLRRVGFAVLEGPDHLLDWGILRWGADVDPVLATIQRISPLLALYSPSFVVLKSLNLARKARLRMRAIDAVMRELTSRSIEVRMLKRADVRLAFRQSGSRNKYQIATSIAERFPELKRKLPTKRKAYQPERYNAVIFDAVALALTHRLRHEACIPQADMEES